MNWTLTINGDGPEELAALVRNLPGAGAPSGVAQQGADIPTHPSLADAMRAAAAVPPSSPAAPLPMPSSGEPAGEEDDDEQDDAPAGLAPPERDSKGLPWDARIHSSSKGVKADGSWRALKGVNKAIVPAIEAELRAAPAPITPPPLAMPPAVAPAPLAPPPVMAPPPIAAPAPMPMPAPAALAPPVTPQIAPPAGAFTTWMGELMPQMQKQNAAGVPNLDATYLATVVQELNTAFGLNPALTVITDIGSQPRQAEICSYAQQIMLRDKIPGTDQSRWQA